MQLNSVKPNQSGKIVKIDASGAIKRRMLDMGLVKGCVVTMNKVAPLGDPIEVSVKGYHLTLRKDEAKLIELEDVQ